MELYKKRKSLVAYNPESDTWALKVRDVIYPCDIESVRNLYAIESNFMGIFRKDLVEVNELQLAFIQNQAVEDHKNFKLSYPVELFPSLKYEVQFRNWG